MPTNSSDFLDLVIIVSVFALVLAVWLMVVTAWSGRRMSVTQRMQERLGLKSKGIKARAKELKRRLKQ